MNTQIESAVFDNRMEAERAMTDLRAAGVPDSAISVVAHEQHRGDHDDDDDGDKTRTGLGVGVGAGALLGLGALAIPGIGPIIAGGALAQALGVGAAAVATGAAVGGAAGGIAGALSEHGVSDEDSNYYEERINNGGIFVSVDTSRSSTTPGMARDILYNAGGHSASRARTATM